MSRNITYDTLHNRMTVALLMGDVPQAKECADAITETFRADHMTAMDKINIRLHSDQPPLLNQSET